MKRIITILLNLIIILSITGCTLEESGVTLENETIGTIGKDMTIESREEEMTDLETNHTIEFKDISLKLKPTYSIETSRAKNWLFTQSSSIKLSLYIDDVPEGIDVMTSQVYSDISLLSKYAKYNGIRQDSLNVEYYSLPTGGISIQKSEPYTIPFQVEAVDKSETFYYMYNGYGSSSSSRITESQLAENVQGAVLNVVWTILIRENQTGDFYIKTINDRVGIPYNRVLDKAN
ncbi:hypothetical protein SAMN05443270_0015 [Lacrimispora sphenoides]|uniref:hypothetical protein n=1 Tax=Lacrimispora sphenoides TaxID=29370 RepID=UPI0008BF9CAA|nr:hypothetical protein [Lacrimispora sphenoides]SET42851.1 hypothetical protein SAMN05443270_0015 [Lacrimispora sphenoides]